MIVTVKMWCWRGAEQGNSPKKKKRLPQKAKYKRLDMTLTWRKRSCPVIGNIVINSNIYMATNVLWTFKENLFVSHKK